MGTVTLCPEGSARGQDDPGAVSLGIGSVKEVPKDELASLPELVNRVTPPGGMYGIFNDQVAAMIAVRRGSYYNMGRYLGLEFLTQVIAGALLTAILLLTDSLANTQQVLLVGLIVLLAEVSIDFQYLNWWGFSARYSFGFAIKRLVGYLVITLVLVNFIL